MGRQWRFGWLTPIGSPEDLRRSPTAAHRRFCVSSPLDLEQAAAFLQAYSDRPVAPVALVIAAYNEEASVGAVVTAVPSELCGLQTEVIVVVDGAATHR